MDKPLTDAIKQYLAQAQVCRLAATRADGTPHIIPLCPVFDGETLYVDIGPKSTMAAAVRFEPRVTVMVDDYYDDWSKLQKVILRCVAERVEGAEQDAAWERIREKFPQYKGIDWKPRMTLALRVQDWIADGFGTASQ
jgi:nitroimidazol reductase NimA-like FMN-containing flavoprotein (pyridoxamine 5'-phosphate oxidase superfamily)